MNIICRTPNRLSLSDYLEANQLALQISHDYHEYSDGDWWRIRVGHIEVDDDDLDACLIELAWKLSEVSTTIDCTKEDKEAVMSAVLEAGLL